MSMVVFEGGCHLSNLIKMHNWDWSFSFFILFINYFFLIFKDRWMSTGHYEVMI